ncbi:MAG: CAP domain-containing protein [Solirubrobacteraceae bacterium]
MHNNRQRHGGCAGAPTRKQISALKRHNAVLAAKRMRVDLARIANQTCANGSLTPQAGNVPAIRAAVLCLIDRERARTGERPLHANRRVELAAQHHTEDMAEHSYFDHVGPSGQSLGDRLRASGYIYSSNLGYALGENIAWGTLGDSTPDAMVAAWMASPEHRSNILESRYQDTGIGVVAHVPASLGAGQPGAMYTQDFGLLIRP